MSSATMSSGATLRLWLPSSGTCLWLVLFLVVNLSDWRLLLINSDGDPCWHWRNGNRMIEQRAVIHTDAYSHTLAGKPLVSKEWLSEVITAAAGNLFGWGGIVALAAGLIATTIWLLHRQLLSEGVDPLLAMLLVLLATLACLIHWLARPLLVTHLLTVLFAWRLRQFEHDRISTRQLFLWLAPAMVLWTNLHGGFVTGLLLIGIVCAGNVWEAWHAEPIARRQHLHKAAMLASLLAVCAVATLINPNGWKLHAHILAFLQMGSTHRYTSEFMSPNFHWPGSLGFLLQLLAVLAMLMVIRPRLARTDILMVGTWLFLSLRSARQVPIFALTVTPILAEQIAAWIKAQRGTNSVWMRLYGRFSTSMAETERVTGGGALAAVCVLALAAALSFTGPNGKPLIDTGIMPKRFPVAAVQWLREHPHAVSGEMFNEMRWGGYLIQYMPERRVFVDSRDDFYGNLIDEYILPIELRPGWEAVLKKYHVGWTLLPRQHPLNSLLAMKKAWSVLYEDDVAVIYGRRS